MLSLGLLAALGGMGCSLDSLLNRDALPPDVSDPALTQTPDGALYAYGGTLAQFRTAFGGITTGGNITSYVELSGLLTDELKETTASSNGSPSVDRRLLPEGPAAGLGTDILYSSLQKTRGQAAQAIGLLNAYLPDQPALAGHLYAIEGYVELFLAELYCSGVPLSTLDYAGNYTYHAGSTTEKVFTHAAALFDTALGLAGDSVRVANLARVGQARALLGLGNYTAAATAAVPVPDGYVYNVHYNNITTGTASALNFAYVDPNSRVWVVSVSDQEGLNGLDWRGSGDPRTKVTVDSSSTCCPSAYRYSYIPTKYNKDGSSPIVLASGIEARLIQAEAQLAAGDGSWLTTLNALRTDGTFEIVDSQAVTDTTIDNGVTPPDTTVDTTAWTYDTLWHAGSGGVDSLAPLSDPGTAEPTARVDLLFRERAFWLYLTGHREGDLRRLIRQYQRTENQVYPIGVYPGIAFPYGSDVDAPVPITESAANPLYQGCSSR